MNLTKVSVCATIVSALSSIAQAATIPMVNLNTDSTSNVVLTNSGTRVQTWFDSATSVGGSQDFGQNTANNRPTWTTGVPMPNGSIHNLVTYAGGDHARAASGNTDANGVDFLTSGTWNSGTSTFTDAPDANYIASGLTWFTVVKSTALATTRQDVIAAAYGYTQQGAGDPNTTFATVSGIWGSNLVDDTVGDADTTNNIKSGASGTVNGADVIGPNAALDTWYIIGTVWDPVAQTIRQKILTPNTLFASTVLDDLTVATLAPDLTNGGYAMTNATNHHVRLGDSSGSAASNNAREFNGQMAEVLIYNSTLNSADFDTAMNYLDAKFFVVPEPNSVAMMLAAMVVGSFCRHRRSMW